MVFVSLKGLLHYPSIVETLSKKRSGTQANDHWVHFSEIILTYLNNKIHRFLFAVESESASGSVCSRSFHYRYLYYNNYISVGALCIEANLISSVKNRNYIIMTSFSKQIF